MAGAASARTAWPWCDDHDMTPQPPQPPEVRSGVADLRNVPFGEVPPVTAEQAVRRVLPGRPVQTVSSRFQSSI